jgi:hypothetical protein
MCRCVGVGISSLQVYLVLLRCTYHRFNNNQLFNLCLAHGILPGKIKPRSLEQLLCHVWHSDYKGHTNVLLFAACCQFQEGMVGQLTVESVRVSEEERRTRYEHNKNERLPSGSSKTQLSIEEAVVKAVDEARSDFPYICPLSNQH